MANRLTLDQVLARVVLEGDSDFALSDMAIVVREKVKETLPTTGLMIRN